MNEAIFAIGFMALGAIGGICLLLVVLDIVDAVKGWREHKR